MKFSEYNPEEFYDEMFEARNRPRSGARLVTDRLGSLSEGELRRRQEAAELSLLHMGITFNVYGDEAGDEKVWPFDIIPRVIEPADWNLIERGLKQRIRVLNLFIDDVYHEQKIVKDGVVPRFVIESAKGFLRPCVGFDPPRGIWCHITGTDLIRGGDGQFYVLEDNLRCPSGVSYVLENRQVLKRTFPRVFGASQVRPVADYPERLLATLSHLVPDGQAHPTVAVLTPGIYNSAYFEHAFLAAQMGVELVEGRDLVVVDGTVRMRTTQGLQKLDVLYRRIDDDSLDPEVFRPDSLLGVPGLMEVYRTGGVAIANAPGTGVADDKVVYCYVPEMSKYYLGEDLLLPNVETYMCWDDQQRSYVLEHLDALVVKAANESGGYGMLIGSDSSKEEREQFAELIEAQPRNYIAQPILELSRVPVIVEDRFEGRHVDLRPRCDWNQRLVRFDLSADPAPDGCSENIDLEGNSTASLWFSSLHDSLNIEARSVVDTLCDNPLNYLLEPTFRKLPFHYQGEAGVLLESYCLLTSQDKGIEGLAHSTSQEVGGEIPAFLSTLNQRIYKLCEKETRLEGDPF